MLYYFVILNNSNTHSCKQSSEGGTIPWPSAYKHLWGRGIDVQYPTVHFDLVQHFIEDTVLQLTTGN
jgi:hypothetical protein